MTSMMRYEAPGPYADGDVRDRHRYDRSVAADAGGLAAFRVHLETDHARSLSALIESEIIPRLMVSHTSATPAVAPAAVVGAIDAAEVAAFAPLVMQVEADTLLIHVEAMLMRGIAFDTLLVDLLAPTARLLGEFWEEDRCDFVDVTMGLWRLQEVVHEIADRQPVTRMPGAAARRALLATMPGDQHSFGTVVVDELFRRDGWITDRMSEVETPDLLRRAADDWFDMIGLTVSCECHIGALASIVAALRNVSRNQRVCVMVGGRIFSADPGLAIEIGADGTAPDAKLALEIAGRLVREREREAVAIN